MQIQWQQLLWIIPFWIGVAFTFWGFELYERLLALIGALAGAAAGIFISLGWQVTEGFQTGESSLPGMIAIVVIMMIIGGALAILIERAIVLLGGFVTGALLGSIVLGVEFGNADHPLISIFGIVGSIIAWIFHKGAIAVITALIGSLTLLTTYDAWQRGYYKWQDLSNAPQSIWFLVLLIAGIAVQFELIRRTGGFVRSQIDSSDNYASNANSQKKDQDL